MTLRELLDTMTRNRIVLYARYSSYLVRANLQRPVLIKMEPNLAITSEVTTVFIEALSIAESVNDMVHLQDQSTTC